MVKQLKLELSYKDKLHNLKARDRGRLISYLYHNFSEANHEKSLHGEKWLHNKLWKYLKANPYSYRNWVKEFLNK
tara:strand:+ start:1126 stop:1350 length:225 start_codon:yes stop_codon:yes gene_type:complete